jgi:hypothetical protein
MSFRATYYVTLCVDAPVNAAALEQAVVAAKAKEWKQLVKTLPGVEANDWKVQLWQVWDNDARGGID